MAGDQDLLVQFGRAFIAVAAGLNNHLRSRVWREATDAHQSEAADRGDCAASPRGAGFRTGGAVVGIKRSEFGARRKKIRGPSASLGMTQRLRAGPLGRNLP